MRAKRSLSIILAFWIVSAVWNVSVLRAQQLQGVRLALSTPTPHMAPLWVAKDRKLFERHGLDVQLILVNSGSLVAQMFAR